MTLMVARSTIGLGLMAAQLLMSGSHAGTRHGMCRLNALAAAQATVGGKAKISGNAATYSQHYVSLQWLASTSPNIAGYNVYRGPSGGPYVKITNSPTPGITYTDSAVQSGQTYCYVATTVDTSKNESAYSNQACATVP